MTEEPMEAPGDKTDILSDTVLREDVELKELRVYIDRTDEPFAVIDLRAVNPSVYEYDDETETRTVVDMGAEPFERDALGNPVGYRSYE